MAVIPLPEGGEGHRIRASGPLPTTSVKALWRFLSLSMLWTQENQGTSKKAFSNPYCKNRVNAVEVIDSFTMSGIGGQANYFYYSCGIVNVVVLNVTFLHVQY